MRSFSLTSFTLFREEQPVRDALVVFILTTLFYFFGAMLRMVQELSLFWPLNAVMAGVFARYAFLNRGIHYAICYAAMLIYDAITTQWGMASLVINLSNMVFIITVAQLVLRDKRRTNYMPGPLSTLHLFYYCLLAAILSSLLGAIGSVGIDRQTFLPLFADWFSEQFSTGVLFLPCIMTLTWPENLSGFRLRTLIPVAALILSISASILVGGAGSLAFPLPALIWCAVRYPLPLTCLLTLVAGCAEILLVANNIINLSVVAPLQTPQLFSTRLGIAALVMSPVMVAASVDAISRLMKQVALRADFDFLTRVYSRSGLYEALKKIEHTSDSHLTVMLLDLDYFKSINDSYGHECGDYVLASFAQQVKSLVGEKGLVARMGGEEFAIATLTTDAAEGYALAERIRSAIEAYPFRWHQDTLRLTVSIGIGTRSPGNTPVSETFNLLLVEADEYLYRSKKLGRNRTSIRRDEPMLF
ncbi:diguanylate cyclase [Trabulsiella odontotermitis]|uniref:GGDEF domain-containing protein n=1 Tax=Trabulsiella odontotermitis TaxID=379893 RepID=UPI003ABE2532